MKQITSIFLILTIVYTTIGVRINAHRCETKNTTSYSILENDNCCSTNINSCTIQKVINDCCTDKIDLVHLGQDIHYYPNLVTPSQPLIAYYSTLFIFDTAPLSSRQSSMLKGRAPPLLKQQENKQALYQVFVI